jgi:hypothetical protein
MADDPHGPLIFFSYSRKDSGLVRKIELIVWATGALPWLDTRSIAPGQKWRVAITRSIERCDRMFLFWCHHSKASSEVRKEYVYAIESQKPVVPLRLDRSESPPDLSVYEEIDLRELTWWRHEALRWERLTLILGIFLLVVGFVYGR